jgi:acetyltransferase-like isoleucine patch superfamily enzyme
MSDINILAVEKDETNVLELEFERAAREFQPWLDPGPELAAEQKTIQALLRRNAGAHFGSNCFVARGAHVFTDSLELGDNSWVAAGAIIRGQVRIGKNTSVNPYAHIAGNVTIGSGVRIAGMVGICGFNHGFHNIDKPIFQQELTSKGISIGDDVWIGANSIILDGTCIGAHSIIGAGAVVSGKFAEYQIIAGNPARTLRDRRTREDDSHERPGGKD